MRNFMQIAHGVDVLPLLLDIQRQPHLWDKNPCRLSKRGPHHETQDMFLRYKDERPNLAAGDWSDFGDPHIPMWNQTADCLPGARRMAMALMGRLQGEILGGVFIYKVEPGKRILRHTDRGWHAEYYDKFNICLQSNERAAFCYEGEQFVQRAGDIHWFTNNVDHWVLNAGECPHIVMTVCLRLDRGERVPWSPEGWTMDKHLEAQSCQQPG